VHEELRGLATRPGARARKTYDWSSRTIDGRRSRGAITAKLGTEEATLHLKPDQKKKARRFASTASASFRFTPRPDRADVRRRRAIHGRPGEVRIRGRRAADTRLKQDAVRAVDHFAFAYCPMPLMSMTTTGSLPTTQASWRRQPRYVARPELHLAAVVHPDAEPTGDVVLQVALRNWPSSQGLIDVDQRQPGWNVPRPNVTPLSVTSSKMPRKCPRLVGLSQILLLHLRHVIPPGRQTVLCKTRCSLPAISMPDVHCIATQGGDKLARLRQRRAAAVVGHLIEDREPVEVGEALRGDGK